MTPAHLARESAVVTTGLAAAGNTHAPNYVYGEWLLTFGCLGLTYAEWLKIAGGVYVILLTLKLIGVFKLARWIWSKIFNKGGD